MGLSPRLQEILSKDEKNWAPEEGGLVLKAIKEHGREVLKDYRRGIRA